MMNPMSNIIRSYRLLLPFENLKITTDLSFSKVLQKLDEVVDTPKIFRITLPFGPPPPKPYEGTIYGKTFKISRIISGRNSFLPLIEGEIYPQPFGCYININMSLHKIVLAFMLLWLWTTGSIGIFALFAWFAEPSIGPIFIPVLGMFIFGLLLCIIPFKIEAKIATKFLVALFN